MPTRVFCGQRYSKLRAVGVFVVLNLFGAGAHAGPATLWHDWLEPHSAQTLAFERFPFAQPLYILYSSGTTGIPKCIVHSAGGTSSDQRTGLVQ